MGTWASRVCQCIPPPGEGSQKPSRAPSKVAKVSEGICGNLEVSQNTFLGVLIIRTILFWGLYWGPLILGNYHFFRAFMLVWGAQVWLRVLDSGYPELQATAMVTSDVIKATSLSHGKLASLHRPGLLGLWREEGNIAHTSWEVAYWCCTLYQDWPSAIARGLMDQSELWSASDCFSSSMMKPLGTKGKQGHVYAEPSFCAKALHTETIPLLCTATSPHKREAH